METIGARALSSFTPRAVVCGASLCARNCWTFGSSVTLIEASRVYRRSFWSGLPRSSSEDAFKVRETLFVGVSSCRHIEDQGLDITLSRGRRTEAIRVHFPVGQGARGP